MLIRSRLAQLFCLASLLLGLAISAARAEDDYRAMVDRVGAMLGEAVQLYAKGDADAAKTKTQQAYFEVFEQLEGPIRINFSAQKNAELEHYFTDIRGMIVKGDPAAAVQAKVDALMSETQAMLPKLESGARLSAEVEAAATEAGKPVEPHWAEVAAGIGATLQQAAGAYDSGDVEGAAQLIAKAQFEGYRNSQLEIAIRRHVSQKQATGFNQEFLRLIEVVRGGQPSRVLRGSSAVLVRDIMAVLPGLPLEGIAKTEQAADDGKPAQDWRVVADRITAAMRQAARMQADGQTSQAVGLIQDTYFDGFEGSGMEERLGARDAAFMNHLEGYFSKVIGLMKSGASAAEIEQSIGAMAGDLDRAVAMLGKEAQSPAALFAYSLMIILREGVEALLIVTALLAYLGKTGNQSKERVIHHSVLVAVLCSLVTAAAVKWAFNATPASQEVLEGGTMLLATVVLFTVSYWLISKAEARKWADYIKGKVDVSISAGSLKALWFTSFLAVYREGAETVLFYQALAADSQGNGTLAVIGGFVLGCVGLAAIYLAMRLGAMRLPIRPFFMATGTLLYLLAFSFAGQGMMELVEGKLFEPTLIGGLPEFRLLGIYPYWQTLAPQAVLLIAAAASAVVLLRKRARPVPVS